MSNTIDYEDIIIGIPTNAKDMKIVVYTSSGECRCYKYFYNEADIIEAKQRFIDCLDDNYPRYTPI